MRRAWGLACAALALWACDSPTEPTGDGVSGYFTSSARADLQLFLYDDFPGGAPEQFFVRQEQPGGVTVYVWGTYVERGDSIAFTRYGERPDTVPAYLRAAWVKRPRELAANLRGVGALPFQRTADQPPEGK